MFILKSQIGLPTPPPEKLQNIRLSPPLRALRGGFGSPSHSPYQFPVQHSAPPDRDLT
jgi:hypothetical protein